MGRESGLLVPGPGSPAVPGGEAPQEGRIDGVGVRALDRRRVDVAVDLAPHPGPLTVEMVIVGPADVELCSVVIVHSRERTLDKIMHLRSDAEPGEHMLHVELFCGERLLDHAIRRFSFPAADPGIGR